MSTTLPRLVDTFKELRLIVLGDAMLDCYLEGFSNRLCREAPVPIVTLSDHKNAPGGAANTAVNIRSLGSRVHFISVTGRDGEGVLLRQALADHGVPTENILDHPGRRTLAKQRVMAGSQMLLRLDQGTTDPIDGETEQTLINRLDELFPQSDGLIISDYGYGVLTPKVIRAITRMQARTPRLITVDSKNLAAYRQVGVTVVKPNYQETVGLLGLDPLDPKESRADQVASYEQEILKITGAQIAAVTLDTDGGFIFEQGSPPYRTYARPRPHSRAAGAGDTFLSALSLALAAGAQTPVAAELASVAASIVVDREGTSACTAEALRGYVAAPEKYVTDPSELVARLAFYRQQGQKVVFTNGCFDILHRGHITYLNQAKALGDILVVGLNSDDSVRRLKGPKRPINPVEDRAQVLAALSCVDHIVSFEEDTSMNLVQVIQPDIYAKGGDYTRETLPEAPVVEALGGEVKILSFLQDISTTNIIERIREAYAWQPPQLKIPVGSRVEGG